MNMFHAIGNNKQYEEDAMHGTATNIYASFIHSSKNIEEGLQR